MTKRAALVAVMLALATPAAAEGWLTGSPKVVDGDGLSFGPVRVRLHGIDAAEVGQHCALPAGGNWDCGQAATDRLSELVSGAEVTCEALDRDAYGRVVARCIADEVDVGATLVAEGLAWAFVRYSDDYARLEADAQAMGLGIWQAESETPWDYRENRWERAVAKAPGGCPIKGNINRQGDQIYHTPWSPWYARTAIDEAAGERWFCDEAEAAEAGWRPARFR